MISDPDDAIRRMESRHAERQPEEPGKVIPFQTGARAAEMAIQRAMIRNAIMYKLLEDAGGKIDISLMELSDIDLARIAENKEIAFRSYEDKDATDDNLRMRLAVTIETLPQEPT